MQWGIKCIYKLKTFIQTYRIAVLFPSFTFFYHYLGLSLGQGPLFKGTRPENSYCLYGYPWYPLSSNMTKAYLWSDNFQITFKKSENRCSYYTHCDSLQVIAIGKLWRLFDAYLYLLYFTNILQFPSLQVSICFHGELTKFCKHHIVSNV